MTSLKESHQTVGDSACVRPKVLQSRIHLQDGGSHVTVLATYGGLLGGQEWTIFKWQ